MIGAGQTPPLQRLIASKSTTRLRCAPAGPIAAAAGYVNRPAGLSFSAISEWFALHPTSRIV